MILDLSVGCYVNSMQLEWLFSRGYLPSVIVAAGKFGEYSNFLLVYLGFRVRQIWSMHDSVGSQGSFYPFLDPEPHLSSASGYPL